jgi:hypothetical protein
MDRKESGISNLALIDQKENQKIQYFRCPGFLEGETKASMKR